jgi:TonB-linked SusC/RagA family outer membrane protein
MRLKLLLTALIMIVCILGYSQQNDRISVAGTVKDDNGVSLMSITVTEKGTKNATQTNATGSFTISIKKGGALIFTGIGFQTKEYKVNQSTAIQITLTSEAKALSDVVVVGYGSQQRAKVTGAVSSVKMDKILGDRPVTSTAALLQGAAPGLNVTIASGQPGAAAPSLNLRGTTDYGLNSNGVFEAKNNEPLIVVDNVPFSSPLNLLDPNDIESVTVLKDAASSAIYGARAAFGVILITTKSGKKNQKAEFTYSNNFVRSTVAPLPYKVSPLQFIQAYIDGQNSTGKYAGIDLFTYRDLLTDYQLHPDKYPGGYTYTNGTYVQLAGTDAIAQSMGNAATQQMHNFSVSGGSDKSTYRLSFGTTNENGIIVPEAHQDYSKRWNLKSVVTTDVTPWLNTQLDVSYNNMITAQPFYQVGIASDFFQQISNMSPLTIIDTVPGVGQVASPKYWVVNTEPVITSSDQFRVMGRTIVKPSFVKGLNLTAEYTMESYNSDKATYDKYASGYNSAGAQVFLGTSGGKYTKAEGSRRYKALDVFATYTKSINNAHNFSLMAGFNGDDFHSESVTAANGQLIDPNNPALKTATGTTATASDGYSEYTTMSYFGRFNYDYKGKYLLQASARADGSSRFPLGHQWGTFPAANIGWRVMEENFMKFLKPYVNEFKLRGSYGVIGNQIIYKNDGTQDYYPYQGVMNSAYANWLNPATSDRTITVNPPSTLISNSYTWEKVATLGYGADWGMFSNHLTGSFDWYKRTTSDILTNSDVKLPAILGTGAPYVNAGELQTKGFEVQLNYNDKIGKVKYNIGVNLSNYSSVVTKYSGNPTNALGSLIVGEQLGNIYGFVTDRLYTVNDFIPGTLDPVTLTGGQLKPGIPKTWNGSAQNPNPGDVLYKDLDGNGIINIGQNTLGNSGDKKVIGNSVPKYQFGVNGGVSYRNFDFTFILYGVAKQDQWVLNNMTMPNYWAGQSTLYTNELNYWTPSNPNAYYARIYTSTGVPVGTGYPTVNQQVQTRYLFNGAYLRVKNLTLRYSVPQKLLSKAHISKLSVFASVEDPFIFDHMPRGVYPDITKAAASSTGSGGGQGYPFMIRSSCGVNLTF